jgi:hypothetical protein
MFGVLIIARMGRNVAQEFWWAGMARCAAQPAFSGLNEWVRKCEQASALRR